MTARWYIIHTYSGTEKRLKDLILQQAEKHDMLKYFEDIFIPVVDVPEVKRGKVVTAQRKIMPGYLLLKMDMNDEAWHLVKSVAKNANFLGAKSKPRPLSEKEVDDVFKQIKEHSVKDNLTQLYVAGGQVTIVDGPFDGFVGKVESVDIEKNTLKVSILIFGKSTSMELSFAQVKKIS